MLAKHAHSALKEKESYFTRGGPLQPDLLIAFLLYMIADGNKRGYRQLVCDFWNDALDQGVDLPTDEAVSAAALCNARRKLTAELFRELLLQACEAFDSQFGDQCRIKGRRIVAADSSKFPLTRQGELWEFFGGPTGGPVPQAALNVLYDVVGKVPLDVRIAPYANDEREQLRDMLCRLRPGDVLVLDRGYPSYELIDELRSRGIDFVIRVLDKKGFPAVRKFAESRATDSPIRLEKPDRKIEFESCDLRAVSRKGKDGKKQILLTSLSKAEFSTTEIFDLYRRRWQIELLFREQKSDYIGHRQFHARGAHGVAQEVFAFYLFKTITRTIMCAAISRASIGSRYIPSKNALMAVGRVLTQLLLSNRLGRAAEALKRLLAQLCRSLESVREPRSFKRCSYKPKSRWNSEGKRT